MNIYNCHTHTKNSPDSTAEPSLMTEAAINAGLRGYAVTDHIDTELAYSEDSGENLAGSVKDAAEQRKKNPQIKILSGVEIGQAILNHDYEKYIIGFNDWDIVMGSVHSVRMPGHTEFFSGIDFTPFSDGFIDSYVAQYFTDLEETAENTDYDSLSHLTVPLRYIVHKYKRKVDLGKYADSIDKILKTVIKRKKSLEVNTSGYTGKDPFFMPCETIIRRYTELGGVDFTIGSDAHIPEKMSCGLSEGAKMLLKLGVTHLNYYEKRQKISYSIKE